MQWSKVARIGSFYGESFAEVVCRVFFSFMNHHLDIGDFKRKNKGVKLYFRVWGLGIFVFVLIQFLYISVSRLTGSRDPAQKPTDSPRYHSLRIAF